MKRFFIIFVLFAISSCATETILDAHNYDFGRMKKTNNQYNYTMTASENYFFISAI